RAIASTRGTGIGSARLGGSTATTGAGSSCVSRACIATITTTAATSGSAYNTRSHPAREGGTGRSITSVVTVTRVTNRDTSSSSNPSSTGTIGYDSVAAGPDALGAIGRIVFSFGGEYSASPS